MRSKIPYKKYKHLMPEKEFRVKIGLINETWQSGNMEPDVKWEDLGQASLDELRRRKTEINQHMRQIQRLKAEVGDDANQIAELKNKLETLEQEIYGNADRSYFSFFKWAISLRRRIRSRMGRK